MLYEVSQYITKTAPRCPSERRYLYYEREPYNHHETYSELELSSQKSCFLCYYVLSALKRLWPRVDEYTKITPFLVYSWVKEEDNDSFFVRFELSSAIKRSEYLEDAAERNHFFSSFKYWPIENFPKRSYIGDAIDIYEIGKIVLRWLISCINTHPTCEKTRNRQWHPARPLLIGNRNKNFDCSMKLVETNQFPAQGPYITLSHRWVGADILKLKKETLEEFIQGSLRFQIPKTSLDTIKIT